MTNETNRKVQYLAGVCAAFIFTYTGATLSWPSPAIPKFLNGEANVVITGAEISWVVSLFSAAGLVGCLIGQVLLEKIGRRRTLIGSAAPAILGAIILLMTTTPWMICVSRFIGGLGNGIIAVVTMIYITEISDKEIRGALGMTVQVMNNLGSLAVYSIGPFVSYTTLNAMILSLPICAALLCSWIPESPYYHLKDGRIEEAKKEFMKLKGIKDEKVEISWVVSLFSAAGLVGCLFGQVLIEKIGRRRTLIGSAAPAVLGAIILMMTTTPWMICVSRVLGGIASGIIAVVTMIYITEISDKEIRGALGMTVQVMNNLGSLAVYSIGPFVSYNALNAMILSIPICAALLCSWIPESPYYHLKDGRIEEAKKEFMKLKGIKDEKLIEDDINTIRAHVRQSMENKTTYKELVTNKRYRKAIYIVIGMKLLQYMTGIVVIQAYLETIFRATGFMSGPICSIVYGFVQLAAGICATFLSRWVGRRILMFTSCLGVSVAMTLVGLYFFLKDSVQVTPETLQAISWLPLTGLLCFNVLYANGIGNLPYVIQTELFPMNVKGIASSAATMLACILGFFVTKCYQQIKDAFGDHVVFWFFASVGYAGLFFIYFCVPETKSKTLEEVQDNVQKLPEEEALNTETDKVDCKS